MVSALKIPVFGQKALERHSSKFLKLNLDLEIEKLLSNTLSKDIEKIRDRQVFIIIKY